MNVILQLLADWFGTKWADSLSKDYRDDPVYKRNVQRLIERNRQFEKKKNEPHT
jgi:hypothetical protein